MFYVHLFTFQLLIAAILSLYRMEVLLAKRQSIQMMSFTDVMKDSFCMVPRELHVRQVERGAKLQAIAKVNFSIESKVVLAYFLQHLVVTKALQPTFTRTSAFYFGCARSLEMKFVGIFYEFCSLKLFLHRYQDDPT